MRELARLQAGVDGHLGEAALGAREVCRGQASEGSRGHASVLVGHWLCRQQACPVVNDEEQEGALQMEEPEGEERERKRKGERRGGEG